jgi:hypothetical protein
LNQVNYEDGKKSHEQKNGHEQKNVDQSPERVERDRAEEPKDKQHHESCPKHAVPISLETRAYSACALSEDRFRCFPDDSY